MIRSPRTYIAALAVAIGALALLVAACGGSDQSSAPMASNAWARQVPAMADMGAAYVDIKGGSDADRLTGVKVPAEIAGEATLHETKMAEDGTMSMSHVDGIDIPAGETVQLKPGGFHIMLMQLAKPLEVGQTVDLTLVFEKGGEVTVPAEVKAD